MEIAFIGRASCYSPRSIEKDHAILAAVRQRLLPTYRCLDIVQEDMLKDIPHADACLSMGRHPDTLERLALMERQGQTVLNSTASVSLCNHRIRLTQQLAENGISVPPLTGDNGYWVKRGKGCRMTDEDVQYAAHMDDALRLKSAMQHRGIEEVEVRAHVTGSWVKFYGVRGTGFFRSYLMEGDTSQSVDRPALQQLAEQAAAIAQLDIYGGDGIISNDGHPVLVDLNDWPSFSPCREEAADAIAQRVAQYITS